MPEYSVFKPVSREEWEQGPEGSIRLGLAKPGETTKNIWTPRPAPSPASN